MTLILMIMSVWIIGVSICKLRSIHTLTFCLYYTALDLFILSFILYLLKVAKYRWVFDFEFAFYDLLNIVKINYFDIRLIVSVAIIIFFLASCIYMTINITGPYAKHKKIMWYVVFVVISGAFSFLNSKAVAEALYINKNIAITQERLNAVNFVIDSIHILIRLVIIAMCLLPIIKSIRDCIISKLIVKKRHAAITGVAVAFFDLILILIIFKTPLGQFVGVKNLYEFAGFSNYNYTLYLYLPCVIIVVTLVATYILFRYRIINEHIYLKRGEKKVKIGILDVEHVFHSFKNICFTMNLLQKKIIDKYPNPESVDAAQNIGVYIQKLTQQINKFLSTYNQSRIIFDVVNLCECIGEARKRLSIISDARVEISCEDENLQVYGDYSYLEEMFYNILANASEAIKDNKDGVIRITLFIEKPWVGILIHDNGIGIEKSDIRRIFDPFYTTKKTVDSWGVGLAYVKNVAELHSGFVDVKSEPGKYTEFQAALPVEM